MRDYTYLGGARFSINNLFRSLRFDIDRLDMSWVDGEKPEFSRGLRIVDHDAGNTTTVDGLEGDDGGLIAERKHANALLDKLMQLRKTQYLQWAAVPKDLSKQ